MDWGQFYSWTGDKPVHCWAYFNGFGINAFISIPVIPAKKNLPQGSGGWPKVSPLALVEHPPHPRSSSWILSSLGWALSLLGGKKTATNFHLLVATAQIPKGGCWERKRSVGNHGTLSAGALEQMAAGSLAGASPGVGQQLPGSF